MIGRWIWEKIKSRESWDKRMRTKAKKNGILKVDEKRVKIRVHKRRIYKWRKRIKKVIFLCWRFKLIFKLLSTTVTSRSPIRKDKNTNSMPIPCRSPAISYANNIYIYIYIYIYTHTHTQIRKISGKVKTLRYIYIYIYIYKIPFCLFILSCYKQVQTSI